MREKRDYGKYPVLLARDGSLSGSFRRLEQSVVWNVLSLEARGDREEDWFSFIAVLLHQRRARV